MSENRKLYEIGYLLNPLIAEDKLADEVSVLRSAVEKAGGKIVAEGEPKMKKLAYQITKKLAGRNSKHIDAFFGWVKFEAASDEALKIDAELKKNTNILRFILIKTVIEEKPAPRIIPIKKEKEEKTNISEKEVDDQINALLAEKPTV